MKRINNRKHIATIALILLLSVAIFGCNKADTNDVEPDNTDIAEIDEPEELEELDSDDTSNESTRPEGTDSDHSSEVAEIDDNSDKDERSSRQRREYLQVLRDLQERQTGPAGEYTLRGENLDENRFAIFDVDGDGEDELVFDYTTASMAESFEIVYHYNTYTDTLETKLSTFPSTEFYTDGFVKCFASHNHSLSLDFWPYTLMHFSPYAGEYVKVADISAWDKSYREEGYNDEEFPEELDTDGDGTLYYIVERGSETEDGSFDGITPVNQEEYDAWIDGVLGNSSIVELPWQNLTKDNIDKYDYDA